MKEPPHVEFRGRVQTSNSPHIVTAAFGGQSVHGSSLRRQGMLDSGLENAPGLVPRVRSTEDPHE